MDLTHPERTSQTSGRGDGDMMCPYQFISCKKCTSGGVVGGEAGGSGGAGHYGSSQNTMLRFAVNINK